MTSFAVSMGKLSILLVIGCAFADPVDAPPILRREASG